MSDQSRRAFLKRAAALSAAGTAAPFLMNLAGIGEAAAATATDYKAMVCVFLYGGNDWANTLTPYDTASFNAYTGLRSNIAYARSDLAATSLLPSVSLPGAVQYALAPALAPLLPLWTAGRMAAVLNVGTLVQPTTKAQYIAKSVQLPPKLFSHNDQQSFWQASSPEGARSGWGGRIGDVLQSGNGTSTLTCITAAGNAVFLSGRSAIQYGITPAGPIALNNNQATLFGSAAASTALKSLITAPRSHVFENEYDIVTKRSLDLYSQVSTALAGGPTIRTAYPTGNSLADQLKIVARMISVSKELGAKRQVFFVSLGGFDLHDSLATKEPLLLALVANALKAFYDTTVELGVSNQVTAFTASDFGRALESNNDGADHGWGSMHFVLGDAVRGGRHYGTPPVLANNGPDDVGQGRLIPTISVDQYAATLASWFGVGAGDLATVLPYLGNFDASVRNLGFV